eukprot:c14755_g1_i1 orf=333-1751(+)
MVDKPARDSYPLCGAAGRLPLAAILWCLATWAFLISLYLSVLSPSSSTLELLNTSRSFPLYRELEEYEDGNFTWERPRGNDHDKSWLRKQSSSGNWAPDGFFDVPSPEISSLLPDNEFAIDPSKCTESERHFFYPGREWRDTEGRPIQAHGGGILYVPETKTYYWYGENKDGPTYYPHQHALARVDLIGVSCYSSKDLWTWKNEGIVLAAEKMNKTHDLYVANVLERPKVIYNDRTHQYIMWMHIDDANYSKAFVGVAVSSSPVGPFHYIASGRPHGYDSRDMTLFKDDNGQAYLVYASEQNSALHIAALTRDYLKLKKVFHRALLGQHRESPAVFKHKGLYYMISSDCTGWEPNIALAHAAESMLGPWETLGSPCEGGNETFRSTTFSSQGTFVFPLPGLQDTFLFMADRWNPRNLSDSRYVWLLIRMDGLTSTPKKQHSGLPFRVRVSIHWHKKWKLPEGWNSIVPLKSS